MQRLTLLMIFELSFEAKHRNIFVFFKPQRSLRP